ncbi:MAG: shikimate dehydrogenase [Lachnospiraceae bacterium]|nr:shikimate dehydrogenase [Lachnospiraceae bacterium]
MNNNEINLKDKVIEGYELAEDKEILGIFGNPIKHTLSPVIHDNLSDMLGLNERYIPFQIEERLGDYVKAAYESQILGLNITVPYKEKVIPYLVDIDEDAEKIGAVNTLVRADGGYKGYNTDMEGLYRSVTEAGFEIKDNNIIMLGAGGAARAVAYMCVKYGAKKVYIVNRTLEKAEKLADDMNMIKKDNANEKTFIPIAASDYIRIPNDRYLFIQSTSIGLNADDGLPLVCDENFYDMADAAVDLIYNPEKTKFLEVMSKKKIPYINGLKMLLYQGIIAFEYWNNVKISQDMSEKIYSELKKYYSNK